MRLHGLDGLHQFFVMHAKARHHFGALVFGRAAHRAVQKLLGHGGRQRLAVALANQGQHHVHGGRAPGAADAPLAPFKQLLRYRQGRKTLLEGRLRLPVQRDRVAAQEARLRQHKSTRINRAQGGALAVELAQRLAQGALVMLQGVKAGHHKQGLHGLGAG